MKQNYLNKNPYLPGLEPEELTETTKSHEKVISTVDIPLISFSGKKGSGKDSISNRLVLDQNYYQCSFGGYLKEICERAFGVPKLLLEGSEEDRATLTKVIGTTTKAHDNTPRPLSVRELLQVFGTDICRKFHEDIWVNSLFNKLEEKIKGRHLLYARGVVISDVRFPNEVKAIQRRGGIVIRLLRQIDEDTHVSERVLDDYKGFNYILDNRDMSLNEQYEEVMRYIGDTYYE